MRARRRMVPRVRIENGICTSIAANASRCNRTSGFPAYGYPKPVLGSALRSAAFLRLHRYYGLSDFLHYIGGSFAYALIISLLLKRDNARSPGVIRHARCLHPNPTHPRRAILGFRRSGTSPTVQGPYRVRLRFGLETRVGQLEPLSHDNGSGLAYDISPSPALADHAGLFRAALYH
jgi:hypothetical protein